jgi:glucosylceramidase
MNSRINITVLKMFKINFISITACALLVCLLGCSSSSSADDQPVVPGVNEVDFWLTTQNGSSKLERQNTVLDFGTVANTSVNIEVQEDVSFQSIDGFGYTLTGGSAEVINNLNAARKQELLQDLFNNQSGLGISYLRLSIGASDLNSQPFTYDDMPSGETDASLANFSLAQDSELIALLKEILLINPNIKIVATPWSAPVWMKDNGSFTGGSLQAQYYNVYAQYFVKYIQAMQSEGITITAITPQNEPLNPYNNPSMVMQASEQLSFIKNSLGPAFQASSLNTKIIIYDHNCDITAYATSILTDPIGSSFVDGSAFHLYAGDINALSTVRNANPSKNIYFTEQYTASTGDFGGDLKWHVKNVLIGATRNWSKNVLEWNLANDGGFGPHTNGGCTTCKGAITINGSDSYSKNVAYYIIGHASKFVPAGSVRIASNTAGNLNNVAFKRPDGKIVLIVENDASTAASFNILYNGEWVKATLEGGAVATYVW